MNLPARLLLVTGITTACFFTADDSVAQCDRVIVEAASSQGWTLKDLGATDAEKTQRAWEKYLANLNKAIPGTLARKARRLWSELSSKASIRAPDAGPTPQDSFIMTWDDGRHHAEVELFPDGRYEWFYSDREQETYEGSEGNLNQAVEAVVGYLQRFA